MSRNLKHPNEVRLAKNAKTGQRKGFLKFCSEPEDDQGREKATCSFWYEVRADRESRTPEIFFCFILHKGNLNGLT